LLFELSLSSWLVAGVVPGIARQPLKKLEPDETELLRLVQRWRDEAVKSGCAIERVVVAYEAGRDGFWLARWLRAHEIEVHVIHSTSVAVSRENRPARHLHVAASVHGLATRRAGPLRHGRGSNDRAGGRETAFSGA
jgi:transposase